jgi:uncharacterized membrane protein
MQKIRRILSKQNLPVLLLVVFTGFLLATWLYFTPPGLLGKADAVGYAVCHRIAERSFQIGDRQTPVCARCSGTFLGALLTIVVLSQAGRRAGLPTLKMSIPLGIAVVAFGIDGLNSYVHLFPIVPGVYEPQNSLRLLTGTGLGIGIGAILVPVFNQTLWQDYDPQPALDSWKGLLKLFGWGIVIDLAVYSQNPLLLYPLAVLSSLSVLLILTMVYSLIWLLVTKRENMYLNFKHAWVPLLAGFTTALLQISLMDAARFILTGGWGGFTF